jgi:hypothetical protein
MPQIFLTKFYKNIIEDSEFKYAIDVSGKHGMPIKHSQ